MKIPLLLQSDYFTLAKFSIPLVVTDVVVDIGEQFLNRSITHSSNVVDTLAAFGLAYVIIKFFVGVMEEVKQVGVVLVQDRPGFHKILVYVLVMGASVMLLAIIIAETQLGVWLIEDLHGVTCTVSSLTHQALLFLSAYPLLHAIAWYHGGVLLQYRYSSVVGIASFSDIFAQIIAVGILLWTPLICHTPVAVPIVAAYCGVLTRCSIITAVFYYKVYPQLSKSVMQVTTVCQLVTFVAPLMFVLAVQRFTRPMINLLTSHFSRSKDEAALSLAVLTAVYPLGHIVYGWLNQLRPISPTFQKKSLSQERKLISGRKIAFYVMANLGVSVFLSFTILWIPGISQAIMENVIGVTQEIAEASINPLRVFAFFCFPVAVRASLTGWLTLHRQTWLVTPRGFLRVLTVLATFFILLQVNRVDGALRAVLALFSGFFAEMVIMSIIAPIYACWRRRKHNLGNLQQREEVLIANEEDDKREEEEVKEETVALQTLDSNGASESSGVTSEPFSESTLM